MEDGKIFYFTNNVFEHHATEIGSADGATFAAIDNSGFALDRDHVYWKGRSVAGAEPSSFKWIKAEYGIDSQSVFYEASKIIGASPNAFKVLDPPSWKEPSQWGRDDKSVYFRGSAIRTCDPETFTPLKGQWAKDSQCVYINYTRQTTGIDASSFTPVTSFCGKDKHGYWIVEIGRLPVPAKSEADLKVCSSPYQ